MIDELMKNLILIFDTGATNVRVMAVRPDGTIEASASSPNNTVKDPYYSEGLIWDVDDIWKKLTRAARQVTGQIDKERIAGVSVTTFGVDGAFVDAHGKPLYPVISWQCERTHPIMQQIDQYIARERLYNICGVYPYGMNTINKFIWLKKHHPEVIDKAEAFLFMSALLLHRLSGQMVTNATMAGTSMLMDARKRTLSGEILEKIGIPEHLFPPLKEAGEMAGGVTAAAADETGIPSNTPVFVSGHDTQFAILGSGAGKAEPVLSSGTWEILMARSPGFTAEQEQLNSGITTELDAMPGLYNIGLNWIGSGPLEWMRKQLFRKGEDLEDWDAIIAEARQVAPGSNGIRVNPDFAQVEKGRTPSGIFGLRLNTTRGEIFRAALEALSFTLKNGLLALEKAGGFSAEKIILVGGGSRNQLWNQIRADVTQKPLQLVDQKEATVLGAALFGFVATGTYPDIETALKHLEGHRNTVKPSENQEVYQDLQDSYLRYL